MSWPLPYRTPLSIKWLLLGLVGMVAGFVVLIWWAAGTLIPTEDYTQGFMGTTSLDSPEVSEAAFSVMTYNIGFGGGLGGLNAHVPNRAQIQQNLDKMVAAVRAQNPDILCVQEIDMASRRSTYIDEVRWIATQAGFPYYAVAYTWAQQWVPYPTTLDFRCHFGRTLAGQAVFSKFPIHAQQVLRFPKPGQNSWIYNLFYLDRVAQILTLDLGAQGLIRVVNVHLEAWNARSREAQVAQLLSTLGTLDRTIVAGDFNTIPDVAQKRDQFSDDSEDDYRDDRSFSQISRHLSEVLPAATPVEESAQWTYPSDAPSRRLDYIFYGPGLTCSGSEVVQSAGSGSDHLPVAARFRHVSPQ